MDALRQDIRYALRGLRGSPGFALLAVVTLALGIGANTAIFSAVDAVLLAALPYPQPDRLVRVYAASGRNPPGTLSGPQFLAVQRQVHGFAAVAASSGVSATLTGSGAAERLEGEVVSASYFEVLGVAPLLGRTFGRATAGAGEERQVVLSWQLWRTRFGGEAGIVGRTLTLNGQAYTAVGVMPRGFEGMRPDDQLWTLARTDVPDSPFTGQGADPEHAWGARYLDVLGRLRPDASTAAVAGQLDALARRLSASHPDTDAGERFVPRDWHDDLVGDSRRPLMLLLAAVGAVLLIACANIANLLLTRGAARQREVTIRMALGAPRSRIARQFLTESVILGLTGGAGGLALAYATLGPLKRLAPGQGGAGLRLEHATIDVRVLLFALGAALLAGLAAGVVPAVSAAAANPSSRLREGGRGTTEGAARHRLRALLVTAEVALSLVLLVSAGLLIRSFARLTATDPGFESARVAAISLPLPQNRYDGARVGELYGQLLERVRALPGVSAAGAAFPLPLTGKGASAGFVVEGRPAPDPEEGQHAGLVWATPGYFEALRIPVRAGRALERRDAPNAAPAVVVNEALARRYWPGEDAVGRRVKLADDPADTTSPWLTVVGVVGDVRPAGLDVPPAPELYIPLSQNSWPFMALVVRTAAGDPLKLVPAIRREVAALDPNLPLGRAQALETVVDRSVAQPRFRTLLLSVFAFLALLLAGIGIYGVVSFGVTQRLHEIGVRMALGATPGRVLRLVVRQGLAPVVLGLAVGLAGALAAARLLAGLLYQVGAWDPATFLLVPLALLAVATLAVWLPARRATRVDPGLALRAE